MVQVGSGGLGVHAGVDEPNQVGKLMVAEEEGDGLSPCRQGMRAIEFFPPLHGAIATPVESQLLGPSQNAFVGCRPDKALLGGQCQNFVRYTSFAGPQP